MLSKAAEPGCDVAKDLWPGGCQSCVNTTWSKRSLRRLTTGTTASPSATASAPSAQKSFCTSMISSTSSSRICILEPAPELIFQNSSAKQNPPQQGFAGCSALREGLLDHELAGLAMIAFDKAPVEQERAGIVNQRRTAADHDA